VTYKEFLPLLLGDNALEAYEGYDASVNAGIANEFSTAAYRFGHTMLSPQLLQVGDDGTTEAIALRSAFFNPTLATESGIDSLLKGLASQVAQEVDNLVVDDVRNFLFGPPGSGGFDLASLNIQRGRDHGLASYNNVREALGLGAIADISEITSNEALQDDL